MKLSVNSKGVSLIAAIFIIVIVAFMGVIFLTLIMTGSSSSLNDFQSNQALYVAQGGLEFILANRVFPNYSTAGAATNLGAGNFVISTPAYLTGAIAAGSVNIPVDSTVGFANPAGRIVIGSEVLTYNAVGANAFTVPAGTVVAHATGEAVYPVTTVTADPGVAGVDIQVNSTAGFRTPGVIMINNEFMFCTGTTGVSFTGCARSYRGTQATIHPIGTNVFQFVVTSTGNVGNARRVVTRSLHHYVGATSGAMMVYAHNNNIPYYRRWNGYEWGPELQAIAVGGNIEYMVLKFSRTRNEAILGTLDTGGEIWVQVWNGNTNTWGNALQLDDIGGADDAYRGFDIEYETANDRAVVVYNDTTGDPNYMIWNGAWNGPGDIPLPTAGDAVWIEMAPNPLAASNEIALMVLSAGADVYGMRWTGGGWNNMGVAATWDTAAAASTTKVIDVAYEQQSGRAMFIWGNDDNIAADGDGTNPREQRHSIWNGVALGATNTLTIAAMGDVASWVRLVPDPLGNGIIYGVQDSAGDLNTRYWNGAAWDGPAQHPEHDAGTEIGNTRNFDIVFETAPANAGQAWLSWGNGTTLSRRPWAGAWGGIANTGDDTSLVQLFAHPKSGVVFSGIYENTTSAADDIWETHLIAGSATWSPRFTVWGGPVVAPPAMERLYFGAERVNSPLFLFDWQESFP